MKKVLCLMLSVLAVLAFAACGDSADSSSKQDTGNSNTGPTAKATSI